MFPHSVERLAGCRDYNSQIYLLPRLALPCGPAILCSLTLSGALPVTGVQNLYLLLGFVLFVVPVRAYIVCGNLMFPGSFLTLVCWLHSFLSLLLLAPWRLRMFLWLCTRSRCFWQLLVSLLRQVFLS